MKPDKSQHHRRQRRVYPEELKKEAVQMLFDGHSASSVAQNLGIGHTSLLYRWKAEILGQEGRAASALEIRAYLCYYDAKRRHSSLKYLTPCEFELCEK